LLIIKDGKLVFENYYNGWEQDSLHQLQSATKSIISTLLGCAIQQQYIKSENDLIATYYSQYQINDHQKKTNKNK
jgi:CubicO group peptidase (beta-lactamase class C family)